MAPAKLVMGTNQNESATRTANGGRRRGSVARQEIGAHHEPEECREHEPGDFESRQREDDPGKSPAGEDRMFSHPTVL